MLMKWKAEKELKRKLESEANAKKKPFKVSKTTVTNLDEFKKTLKSNPVH